MSNNDDTRPGFAESVIKSSTAPAFYAQIMNQPSRRTIFYLLKILAIVSILLSIPLNLSLVSMSGRILQAMEAEGFPTVIIKDGIAEADPPDRYHYQDTETDIQILIDTQIEGDEATTLFKEFRPHMMLSRRKLIIKVDETGWREYELHRLNSMVLDISTFRTLRRILIALSLPLFPFVLLVFNMANRILYAMTFGAFGWLFIGMRSQRMTFRQIFQIAIYALTFPVFLDAFLTLLGWNVPYIFSLFYLLFLIRGLKLVPVEESADTTAPTE